MAVVTLITLIGNISETEVATFKMSFWSSLLKVIIFLIGIKVKAEGSLLVQSKNIEKKNIVLFFYFELFHLPCLQVTCLVCIC